MSPKSIRSSFSQVSISETDSDCVSTKTVIPPPEIKERVKSPENVDNDVVSSERIENLTEKVSDSDCVSTKKTVIPPPEIKERVKSPENVDNDVVSSERIENLAEKVSDSDCVSTKTVIPVEENAATDQQDSLSSDDRSEKTKHSTILVRDSPSHTTNSESSIGTLAALDHNQSISSLSGSDEILSDDNHPPKEEEEEVMESPQSVHLMEIHHQRTTNSEISIVRANEAWRVVNQFNNMDRDVLKLSGPNNPLQTFDLVDSLLKILLTAVYKEDSTKVIPLLKCFRQVSPLWKQVVESEVVLRLNHYWSLGGRKNRVARENLGFLGFWGENQILEAFKLLSTYHSTFANFRNGNNTYSNRFWVPSGYACSSMASKQSEIICGLSNGSLVWFHVGNERRISRHNLFQPYLTDEKLGSSAIIGIFFGGDKQAVYGEAEGGYIISMSLNSSEEESRMIIHRMEGGTLIGFEGNQQGWVALYSNGVYRVWNRGILMYTGEGLNDILKLRVSTNYFLVCSRDRVISFQLMNPTGAMEKIFYSESFFLPNTFDANEKEFVVVERDDALVVRIKDFSAVQRFHCSSRGDRDLNMGSVTSHFWLLRYFQGEMICLGLREPSRMRVLPEAPPSIIALKADDNKIVAVSDGRIHLWHM